MPWGDLLAEGADGGEGDDGAYAEGFEGRDVGARGDGGRGMGMMFAMSSEEGDECAGRE